MTIGPARPRPPADQAVAGHSRRVLVVGAWLLGALAAYLVYLRLAETRAVNSDGAAQALQAWDMLHGNPLLRGWTTSDVSFYTTELPQYMLVELARGLGGDTVHIAAAMTYTLVILLAALVAKGTATGREAVVRVALTAGIMLAPQLGSGTNVLLSSPDHIGTSVPLLAAWLVLDRARPCWHTPVIVSSMLAVALVADSITAVAGVIPLVLVCAFRTVCAFRVGGPFLARISARWYEIALGGGAIVAVGAAQAAGQLIRALGGYTVRPLGAQVAPLGEIVWHNLPIAAQCLLLLPGADFIGLPAGQVAFFVALHLAGAGLAAAGIALAARQLLAGSRPRGDRDQAGHSAGNSAGGMLSQVLLACIAVNVLAFVVTTRAYAVSSAREIAPVLPFAAALAGRQLARRVPGTPLARRIALPALGVVLVGYLAGLGLELTTQAAAPQAAELTSWLESNHLGTGLCGYWEASVVSLTSGNRAAVRPVTVSGGRVVPATNQVKASWYEQERSTADFVVLFPGVPGYPGFTQRRAVLATFGNPARTYHVGRYTVLYWRKNLLSDLAGNR